MKSWENASFFTRLVCKFQVLQTYNWEGWAGVAGLAGLAGLCWPGLAWAGLAGLAGHAGLTGNHTSLATLSVL